MVESFKSTLEEVQHADIILHLRDISNPMHEIQKDAVLKILRELGFWEGEYEKKVVEVWNKVDLIDEQ